MSAELVKSVSIENMLNQRAAVLERLGRAVVLIQEAAALAGAAHVGFPRIRIDEHRYDVGIIGETPDALEAAMGRVIDRGAWAYLMSESGLRSLMDAKSREEWDRAIEKGEFPSLTLGNIEATFQMLYGARGDMFERGVIAVFKQLSWSYKTNQPFRFGKRIVLTYLRHSVSGPGNSLGYVNQRGTDRLDDLMRVLCVLDGQPEPDHRQGMFSLINRVNTTADPDAANDYLAVRCFRNGNGHVTFKRPDLVERMNAIIGKHYPGALPWDHRAAA